MEYGKGPVQRHPFRVKCFGFTIFRYVNRCFCFPRDGNSHINMYYIIPGFEWQLPVFGIIFIVRMIGLVVQFQKTGDGQFWLGGLVMAEMRHQLR